jgi:hypothetical protein
MSRAFGLKSVRTCLPGTLSPPGYEGRPLMSGCDKPNPEATMEHLHPTQTPIEAERARVREIRDAITRERERLDRRTLLFGLGAATVPLATGPARAATPHAEADALALQCLAEIAPLFERRDVLNAELDRTQGEFCAEVSRLTGGRMPRSDDPAFVELGRFEERTGRSERHRQLEVLLVQVDAIHKRLREISPVTPLVLGARAAMMQHFICERWWNAPILDLDCDEESGRLLVEAVIAFSGIDQTSAYRHLAEATGKVTANTTGEAA